MRKLRVKFDRFCYAHSHWGIPNLMLYVVIGSAIVLLASMINGGSVLYFWLCFDKAAILQGQVWRLVTFVFTYSPGSGILTPVWLYFFYTLGRNLEKQMGTLRFNLFYFTGILLMDVFAMIFFPSTEALLSMTANAYTTVLTTYYSMGYYLHLTLLLAFATMNPDSHFLIALIIPVKGWIMGIVYLVFVAIEVFNASVPTLCFPHNLFPLVAVANYFLYFDVRDLFSRRPRYARPVSAPRKKQAAKAAPANYQHRCVVCGRTDVSHPELEFRYCSKCNGYFCYCEDHINNHTHVQ